MKRRFLSLLLILTVASLTACSARPTEQAVLEQPAPVAAEQADQPAGTVYDWDQTTQVDEQGAIVVEATPLNLNEQLETLEFEVVMDTHSVDLSMDLAQLATLTTDSGKTVQATIWDAPRGGHHVRGQLIFPASDNGASVLEGATRITVEIKGLDADLRIFEWPFQ